MSKEKIGIDDYTKGYYNQGLKDAIKILLEHAKLNWKDLRDVCERIEGLLK